METVIIIGLLAVIVLLLWQRGSERKKTQGGYEPPASGTLPDIMGHPRTTNSLSVPKSDHNSLPDITVADACTLDEHFSTAKNAEMEFPQEEPVTDRPLFDLAEEEKEWSHYGLPDGDNGFAQGVTFEELSAVEIVLGKSELHASKEKTAAATVQKIQGTDLLSLLEGSMESASKSIAALLDVNLRVGMDSGSSILRNEDDHNFNLGDYF